MYYPPLVYSLSLSLIHLLFIEEERKKTTFLIIEAKNVQLYSNIYILETLLFFFIHRNTHILRITITVTCIF